MTRLLGQAGRPTGLIGKLFGRIMAWHNGPDNVWTIECLECGEGDRILEIGFGPGQALEVLTRTHPSISAVGVDHSAAMLEMAASRNAAAIRSGRAHLELASATSLPFADATFDKAYSINCIYFWDDPVRGLREILRALKPGGRAAVTVRDKSREAYRAFRAPQLEKMFSTAGFSHVVVLHNGVATHPLLCALGEK